MSDINSISKQVDVLPLVKHTMQQLKLYDVFAEHVPCAQQAKVEPAEMLCMLVANIMIDTKPLYKVSEWVSKYADGLTEEQHHADLYNDDRLGWSLDKLFEANRNTMLTRLSVNAIEAHQLTTDALHNDTTTVTFQGAYDSEPEEAVKLKHGHNKDHRPDCKQLVFGLTTTDDGHVPLHYKLFDGNKADAKTHIPIWNELKKALSREDFIYIADCKLCSMENLTYIAEHGGQFITVMPKNRIEVKDFYKKLATQAIAWEVAYEKPNSRNRKDIVTYKTYTGEKSAEGYQIIWVHSSSKAAQDKKRRINRIEKASEALNALIPKLNKRTLKKKASIEQAIMQVTQHVNDFFTIELSEQKSIEKIKKGRGRPTKDSDYEDIEKVDYTLQWSLNQEAINIAAKTDGVFPLVTNTELEAKEVLKHYKDQPYLENKHSNLKSVLEVAPVFLKKEQRIEALMFLYFIALMIISLIERRIRKSMKEEEVESIAILPSQMKTDAPTWNNIRYFFEEIHQSIVTIGGEVKHVAVKGIKQMHEAVLKLLKIPKSIYVNLKENWWQFNALLG